MYIFKIEIDNYRLLKEFSMDLEEELSLVIGKNNTGKTSVLTILDKFLTTPNKNTFSFDDFNINFKNELRETINNRSIDEPYTPLGIKLRLFIYYTEEDNLSNISHVMMDLDPDNNVVVLSFEYILDYDKYILLGKDFCEFDQKEQQKKQEYKKRTFNDFLKIHHAEYFTLRTWSLAYDKKEKKACKNTFIDLKNDKHVIENIINFKYISAKRDVANKDIDKTLSGQTSRIYRRTETNDDHNETVERFKDTLSETDDHLSGIYSTLFKDIVGKVRDFGGVKINESQIEIISTLQDRELLEGNTTVVYKHDDHNHLPEHYNGLGYMNLISMIFEIEILVNEFKKEKDKKPADINLLFIEEPEAHTHPQMQYVFIKNIKQLLKKGFKEEDGKKKKLQSIISTHSAHIVADSDFDDIKYLKLNNDNPRSISANNLKDLENTYDQEPNQYQFLKQYLTINRAEIFFADKAVLIEGDTERILIPTFMRKLDLEEGTQDEHLPLLSQNISVIEVGAYSQIFEKFIDFLGIKSLVITDIDSIKKVESGGGGTKNEACPVVEGIETSNTALNHYFPETNWDNLKQLPLNDRILKEGRLLIVYQVEEQEYHARSFEDAFIQINRNYVKDNKDSFRGLQNKSNFENGMGAYELAEKCIKKKTHFALDILYHSNNDFSNWEIPAYIKEGLLWLKKD